MPAVGDIDAFLKIPRPDEKDDKLGLGWLQLDEPTLRQTDPAVLDQILKHQASSGGESSANQKIHSLKYADKNPKRIEEWISEISNLNKSKPSQTVSFNQPMPDIDSIMAVWPESVEKVLSKQALGKNMKANEVYIPKMEELDCSLQEYATLICKMFDIPVYDGSDKRKKENGLIQSLHVLFSTYSHLKSLDFFEEQNKLKDQNKTEENIMTFD